MMRRRSDQSFGKTAPDRMRDRPDPTDGWGWGKLGVDPVLKAKAGADRAYREFLNAVASACASPEAESLEMASYNISENLRLARHTLPKMILRVDFAGGDFENKRERRMVLRDIVEKRIDLAGRMPDVSERIDEMSRRFFIIASW